MNDLPKYSVLMSLYINENPFFFRSALDSMLNQTVKPSEIVVVEDGPLTEALYAVVDEYKKLNVIKIVKNEKNLGLGLALNAGLKACSNEFVARMDTDDVSFANRCELQLKYFILHPEMSIVGGQIEEFIDDTTNVVGKRIVPLEDSKIKWFAKKRCPFNHMSVMFRRSDVLEVGNYQDFFWNEDYFLWIRMFLANMKCANIPESLVKVRVGREMYKRRGGWKYFKSEKEIQEIMLKSDLISLGQYCKNVLLRFVVEVALPNVLRGYVFKCFARER